jgi:hypothetical protein
MSRPSCASRCSVRRTVATVTPSEAASSVTDALCLVRNTSINISSRVADAMEAIVAGGDQTVNLICVFRTSRRSMGDRNAHMTDVQVSIPSRILAVLRPD